MRKLTTLLVFLGVINFHQTFAQEDSTITVEEEMFDLSLEDLLNMEVAVASKKAISLRESPGIITVVTEEEIKSSGARDLMDVLRLVPGIHFNSDVEGQVGISMRGNWGLEGKVLMMIDGLELNENSYGSVVFGNHYDPSQISRIEIIRGPGSSIYGGYAELGVIHIITKSGEEYQGGNITYTYGSMENADGVSNLSAGVGDKVGDLSFDFKAFSSSGQRSDQKWVDWYEGEAFMGGNSDYRTTNFNVGVQYKGLSARGMFDDYKTKTVNMYGESVEPGTSVNFQSLNTEIKYDWEVLDNLTITPKVNYYSFLPWVTPNDPHEYYDEEEEYFYTNRFKLRGKRTVGNLAASWDPTKNINVIIGGEYFNESGEHEFSNSTEPRYHNGEDKISYDQVSAYGQIMWMNDIVNVTAGGRFTNHSYTGTANAPRIGLTKVINNFHVKALYSEAFRTPSVENIQGAKQDENGNPIIKPERTKVAELELGYKIGKKSILTANIFDITIEAPIIYYYHPVSFEESYENYNQSGSKGFETEYKYKDNWGFFNINYSYQTAEGKLDAHSYQVPGDDKVALGMPQHMLKANTTVRVWKTLHANTSLTWIGERYAIRTVDYSVDEENGELVYEKAPTKALWNIFINYKDLFTPGFDLGFGVNDILNEVNEIIQPYNNYISPMPDRSRTFTFRVSYTFASNVNRGIE